MTKEEFIKKARELHGDKYSYELVPDEFNANSKVKIVCPVHGEFEQCARTHYRKSGCPKCALDGRVKSMRSSNDEFIAKLKTVFGDKYGTDLVEYKDGETKVKLVCDKHGVFEKTPHELLRGNGCPVCGSERGHATRRILFDNVVKRANTIHHNKYDYEKFIYNGFFTKSTIICPIHGEFEQSMSKHLLGQGCPLCGRESSADVQRKGADEFIAESKKKFGDKFDYSKVVYVNNKTNVLLKCDKHGWFEITPQSHLNSKTGCKLCGMEITKDVQTKDKEYMVQKAREVHGDKYTYDNFVYVNWHTPGLVTCPKHGDWLVNAVNHIGNGSGCPKCVENTSKWEDEIYEFIKSLDVECEQSNRSVLNGKEIDILVKSFGIGIECDGLRWHSEQYRDKNYHLQKTEECLKNGVRLIHIFEDEWVNKGDICRSVLSNLFGKTENKVYARKCEIKNVEHAIKKDFLNKNHLQGDANSSINLGLYYEDELVSLMTFSSPRLNVGGKKKEGSFELVRFCSKLNINVIGGASKLLNYFVQEFKPKEITTFSDNRWSDGHLYETLGFKLDHISAPNYFYVDGMKRHNRFKFRKSVLVKEGYDPNKSEHEIMLERGMYRIYDCGTRVYKYG